MAGHLAPHASPSPSTALATGLVAGHVVLQMLALLGWRWSALWLGGLLAAAAAALLGAWRSNFRRPILPRGRVTLGFGDAISAVAVAGVSWAAVTRRIDNPDFIYHWGVKGRKFALAAGIDWS